MESRSKSKSVKRAGTRLDICGREGITIEFMQPGKD